MRWTMKMTKKTTTMGTPPRRRVRAPPARSRTACPPCPSQRWPPPTLLLTPLILRLRTSWDTLTSRRCSATSPPCRASRSHRRLRPATRLAGTAVSQSASEASSGGWAAGCWSHPPPPWMKTSPSHHQTTPPPPPACPHQGWTTPAALPPSPLRPHPRPNGTSPRVTNSPPMLDSSHPDGTSLLCVTSLPRETSVCQGGTGGTSPPGGDTSRCSPLSLVPHLLQEETISVTSPHEAATGG